MPVFIPLNAPSVLLRRQIKNISLRMRGVLATTILYPLRSMKSLNKVETDFAEAEGQAYLCCSVMDQSTSIETGERATSATHAVMNELVGLKNEANDLIEIETMENEKFWRF